MTSPEESTMIEKVARAIAASFEQGSPDLAEDMRMDWQTWVPEARAAIEAMPLNVLTPEMVKAGVEALEDTSPDTSEAFVTMIYNAMQGAALERVGLSPQGVGDAR